MLYISTTSVYGDCQGEWVDEDRPLRPGTARARRRLDAENAWRAWSDASGGELVILRVPGIYGPGRLPLERLRERLPLVREEDSPWTNRVHAADLARICVEAMARGLSGEVYHASDGHPSTMTDYFNRIADLAGLDRPPSLPMAEAAEHLSAGTLSYMRESRRVSNRKLREELGIELLYPDLAAGLPACFAEQAEEPTG